MARAKRIPEPNEPTVGMEVPWHRRGMGPSVVTRVTRRDGRWVSLTIRWQAGCMPCPEYGDQPEKEWSVPMGREVIQREMWEMMTGTGKIP